MYLCSSFRKMVYHQGTTEKAGTGFPIGLSLSSSFSSSLSLSLLLLYLLNPLPIAMYCWGIMHKPFLICRTKVLPLIYCMHCIVRLTRLAKVCRISSNPMCTPPNSRCVQMQMQMQWEVFVGEVQCNAMQCVAWLAALPDSCPSFQATY